MKKISYPKEIDCTDENEENKNKNKKKTNKKDYKEKKPKKLKTKKEKQIILKDVEEEEEKELTDNINKNIETKVDEVKDIQTKENKLLIKENNSNNLDNLKKDNVDIANENSYLNNEDDISNIMNNICLEIKAEKEHMINIQDNLEEGKINSISNKKEKIYNIEIEENIELIKQNEATKNNERRNNELEVKGLEFKSDEPIPKKIMFNGRLFVKDRHQSKLNSDKINYRCKNYRKFENQKNGSFCTALVKRIKLKDKITFDLENNHSKICNDLTLNKIINNSHIISDYKSFIEKCKNYIDNSDIFNKKDFY